MSQDAAATVCSLCKRRDAFFFRRYSGEKLCRKCFVESVEAKVRATIAKYNMLNFDDRIAVAVSGGKDSLSLLHILAKIERRHPKASLVAVTVDEGIKGYRDEALAIAAENCKALGIEHRVVAFKELYGYTLDEVVAKAREKSGLALTACAYCGVLRRRALNVAAREVDADKIATAHTLDDEAQTILLNIFRGDLVRLAKEKPVTDEAHPRFVQKVRPFCEIPEKESALYAYVKTIRFQDVPCPYASEALRNEMRFMLNHMEERHPGTKFAVFKAIERLRPALEEVAKKTDFKECTACGEPASDKLCKVCELLRKIA
ncbi:MAG: TIGR00269 family protein [Candidatus Bathyarchaeota archaeon]|nr:TIGR00269 family protein [Candidatus Bathyarchaeota archaeon]